jgi:hypothetical protein
MSTGMAARVIDFAFVALAMSRCRDADGDARSNGARLIEAKAIEVSPTNVED